MNKNNKYKLGVLGGTFDPAHIGHIKISKEAKERFNLKEVIWAVTKKNPFKNKSSLSLKDRRRLRKIVKKTHLSYYPTHMIQIMKLTNSLKHLVRKQFIKCYKRM